MGRIRNGEGPAEKEAPEAVEVWSSSSCPRSMVWRCFALLIQTGVSIGFREKEENERERKRDGGESKFANGESRMEKEKSESGRVCVIVNCKMEKRKKEKGKGKGGQDRGKKAKVVKTEIRKICGEESREERRGVNTDGQRATQTPFDERDTHTHTRTNADTTAHPSRQSWSYRETDELDQNGASIACNTACPGHTYSSHTSQLIPPGKKNMSKEGHFSVFLTLNSCIM